MKNKSKQLLEKYFPEIEDFRDIQDDVINKLITNNSCLCLMPTGGGKSLIYQIAGLLTKKTTIVISPLIALMEQQHLRLLDKNLNSIILHSGIESKKQYSIISKLFLEKQPDFIFVSPERVVTDGYLEYILLNNREKIGLVVIDEAHCVSQWGHSFRPFYKLIPSFLNNIFGSSSWCSILCLTATLNSKDQDEVCNDFNISKNNIFKSKSLLRKNIKIKFEKLLDEKEKKSFLESILIKHPDEKIIIYTHRKKGSYGTKEFSEDFKKRGFICDYFDADIGEERKRSVLSNFENGQIKIIFATNAFGMGIDIKDIRVIIHYLLPESIEQYYQEIGRVGRDGKDSFAYLLYSPVNIDVRKKLINKTFKINLIKEVFNKKFEIKNETTKFSTINSWEDLSDENLELTLFYYFIYYKIIKITSKGLRLIDCFDFKDNLIEEFINYKNVTGTYSVITISRKKGIPITEIMNNLFTWYTKNKLKLVNAPSKCLFYTCGYELNDEIINKIHNEIQEKIAYRLEGFKILVDSIESNEKPEDFISKYLNING